MAYLENRDGLVNFKITAKRLFPGAWLDVTAFNPIAVRSATIYADAFENNVTLLLDILNGYSSVSSYCTLLVLKQTLLSRS